MKKILTEIYVPAIGRTFDIFIPSEQPMYIILDLIKKRSTRSQRDFSFPTKTPPSATATTAQY